MITAQTLGRAAAIAAACMLAAAAPASAARDQAKTPEKSAPEAKEKRYCVKSRVTGARLPRVICKTRDEWIKSEGFDPAKK